MLNKYLQTESHIEQLLNKVNNKWITPSGSPSRAETKGNINKA